MFSATGIESYKEQQLLIYDKSELLDRLFEEIYISMLSSYDLLSRKKYQPFSLSIDRSIELIQEGLISHLDVGFDIGKKLYGIYNHIVFRLIEANRKRDVDIIEECIDNIQQIRFSFLSIGK